MEKPKDHLNIDFEFLDKKEPTRVTPSKSGTDSGVPTSQYYGQDRAKGGPGKKYNWKSILIISGIILFFGWSIFSGDNQSSSSTNSISTSTSNNLTAGTGQVFSCSDSNYNRAMELKPDESVSTSLAAESADLDSRTNALGIQHDEINSMYVDQASQVSIDNYNAEVDDFNSKNNSLKLDIASWNQRNSAQNNRIDTYNNFLDTNCTPK